MRSTSAPLAPAAAAPWLLRLRDQHHAAVAQPAAAVSVAVAAQLAARAAVHLHAHERRPFVGRRRRRLPGGGPPIGERAVRSAERAAGYRWRAAAATIAVAAVAAA
eukprot:scaffold64540_cov46-Phaeocystis_antarctica.AAC.1